MLPQPCIPVYWCYCRQTLASGSAARSDESSRRAVHASWHRNSMRRKHLIELPEQPVPEHAPGGASDQPDDRDFCSISTLPAEEQLIPRERSGRTVVATTTTYSVPSLLVALPPSPTPAAQEQPRPAWEPSAPPTSISPSPPPTTSYALETDLDDEVCTRPRQTGRRAQSQPRLVSITAVRDESTNELIIRTNSVPGNASAAPLEEAQLQQHQQQQQRQRYDAVESEGSSMGSSRNPSPVSLLSSTTTYSSIGSATDNVTDGGDRRSHPRQEAAARDGPPGGSSATGEVATITASANGSRRDRASMTEQWRTTAVTGSTAAPPPATATETPTAALHEPDSSESDDPDTDSSRRSSRRNDGRPKARWPLAVSRPLATVFCTLGLFNLSRFAVFSVHFGANFVVQFLIFSLLFGIPMMWLQMVLGARIRGGPVTMWRISPICKGIGIALLIAQTLIALYSAISLAWVLVYFRDAFTMRNEKYRWQEPFEYYRGGTGVGGSLLLTPGNQSYRLSDTVADYFNGVVLQRYHLRLTLPGRSAGPVPSGGAGAGAATLPGVSGIGAIRFQLAFNLAILWTLVFVALCRGIRSLGKVVIGLFLCATAGLVAVSAKFLTFINYDSLQSIFPATDWQDFFLNSRSWMSAAQETFLTWGLLGVSVYSLSCRSNRKGACNGRTRRELRRDAFLVALITLGVLLFAAILGSACVQILNARGYYYFPGSYENLGTNVFLLPASQPLPPQHATMPNRWLLRYSMVVGESFKRPYADPSRESGYQVLRLVTELLPASLAAASHENIAPVWGLIAYLTLLLFGLGQLCVMWKPISGAFGDAPSSILLSCVTGLLLGMPMATEGGITVVYYLDTILGAAWWLLLLWIGHILALFLVRGRPFTSDILVNDLKILQSLSAFVAFAWNFLLPIGLIILCILQYRLSNSAALFNWTASSVNGQSSSSYWPLWARQTGGFVQVSFLLLVPIVIVVQIYRYLCSGPPDILDRVDLLLRPPVDGETSNPVRGIQHRRPAVSAPLQTSTSANNRVRDGPGADGQGASPAAALSLTLDGRTGQGGEDDAPPKYTPPPSYTTATGARIAKMLRNSIRRSVRRLMGETSGSSHRQRAALPAPPADAVPGNANPAAGGELPPDYCSVLQQFGGPDSLEMARTAAMPRILFNSSTLGSGSRRYRSLAVPVASDTASVSSATGPQQMTASDVRQILRPATVTGGAPGGVNGSLTIAPGTSATAGPGFTQTLCNTLLLRRGHSMENLVLAAAPIGDSSIITLNCEDDDDDGGVHEYQDDDGVTRQRPLM
uniref:Sodium-neurotransmitter symporter n=1 Tax=Anopheles albimanus TaxID=7167 RepID=A0A182FU45_ANOAL